MVGVVMNPRSFFPLSLDASLRKSHLGAAIASERGRIEFCREGQPLAPWERYGLPAKIPLLRILMLYLLTSPQDLEQVWVPSAQTFVGTESFPQMVQSRLFSRESLVRRAENRSGLAWLIDCLPDWVGVFIGTLLRAGRWPVTEDMMRFGFVSANHTGVREIAHHFGELYGSHDVHFFLLEKGVWCRRL